MKYFRQIIATFFVGILGLNAQSQKDEWQSIFNGKDLSGWYVHIRGQSKNVDPTEIFTVSDGMIHVYSKEEQGSKQPVAVVCTEKDYADYDLRLEYKWGTKRFAPRTEKIRDAGILYHCFDEQVWPSSVECQIQEGDTGDIWAVRTQVETTVDPTATRSVFLPKDQGGVLKTFVKTNGVTGIRKSHTNEKEGWNIVEVKIRGDSAIHIVNGQTNAMVFSMKKMVDGKWVPLEKGKIALQAEYAEVFYRNIEIRPVKTSKVGK